MKQPAGALPRMPAAAHVILPKPLEPVLRVVGSDATQRRATSSTVPPPVPRKRISPTALLSPGASQTPNTAPSQNRVQSVAGFVGEWPQLPDDFSDEAPTQDTDTKNKQLRARTTTMPPPLPRSAPTPTLRLEAGSRYIGDWEVESVLGRGATATVYAVKHREFGKRAALKLSNAALESGELAAKVFAREARIVQLVEHPAMPDVFATGVHEGRPYLVMERLTGVTFSQRLEKCASDRTQALDFLIELCDLLAVAHDARIVHRDLKLENVFVLTRPAPGGYRVKLLDWGFARVLDEEDPLRGMIAGTLTYVAPEQVVGKPITAATDVYSLGVLAYRAILGKKPFSGSDDAELVQSHMAATPPSPTELWPQIPKSLARIMVRMLAKHPSSRPALHEVRAELSAARRRLGGWRFALKELLARLFGGRPTLSLP